MPVAAGISAAGSLGGALIGSNASKAASGQTAQANLLGAMLQQQRFNTANGALSPYYTAGQSALPTLQALLTPGSSAAELAQMPGFQFQSQYGTMAAKNALAAQGLGGSAGPLSTAISNYNQGLAGTYYQNSVNALQNFVNTGASAANSLAGNAINSGNAMAGQLGNVGSSQAAGTLGSANALSGGLGGVANTAALSSLLSGQTGGGGGGLYGNVTAGLLQATGNSPFPVSYNPS